MREKRLNLDNIDHEILKALEKSGKASVRNILKTVEGVSSPQTILSRVKRMERANVFKYTIMREREYTPNKEFGLVLVTQRGEHREKIIGRIKDLKYEDKNNIKRKVWDNVSIAIDLLGRFDIGLLVSVDSIENLGRISAALNVVAKSETLIVNDIYKLFLPIYHLPANESKENVKPEDIGKANIFKK